MVGIGFNINEFKSVVESNGGLMRTNSFLVEFQQPLGMDTIDSQLMSFYCKSSVLPGLGVLTSDIHHYGVGPVERKPYGTVFNDALMSFYVDANNVVRTYFRNWIRLIINPESRFGMNVENRRGANPYEISYKKEYAVDMTITAFSPEGDIINRITLIEAYPNYIGDISMDWNDKNNNMTLPVSFTYRDWFEETVIE